MTAKSARSHLICGDDDFLVALEARTLVDRLVPADNRIFGLETIDGRVDTLDECLACLASCREALATDGLFASDKLVWLREPAFLSTERLSRSEALKGPLADLAAQVKAGLPEGRHLLLTTVRIHRASALFKAFGAAGEVKDLGNNLRPFECERRAGQFLDRWLPTLGLVMDEQVRKRFINRAGTDSRQIAAELEKLRCYLGAGGPVPPEAVDDIVSGGGVTEIWDFTDAFGKRDLKELLVQSRRLLAQSEHPIRLANALETRVSDLLLVREALDHKWAMPDSYAGLRWNPLPPATATWLDTREPDIRKTAPFVIKKLVVQASGWTLAQLRRARHHLVQMRERLVSSPLPQEWLLEVCLVEALADARGSRRAGK